MRILRIRLQNLNSLRGEHEVNFQKEPLLGAGLFAITGQTGAGKSTLLDAITLALYGRAARYGNVSNPEDMMSRHTGECRAEVEFEVARGRFRAVWHLRRGRGKADGNIQPPKRYIYDASGQEQAQSIRESEELIEKLIGLDYQRFMRSVLLAQGEFARFLKASADERAQLLESLTGTEIYSELSELAHREAVRRETEVNALATSLGQVTLFTEAERREREEMIRTKNQELAQIKTELEKLTDQLAQARRLQAELATERELLAKEQELLRKKEAAQNDLQRLASHRKTTPFAEDLTHLDAAAKRYKEVEASIQSARTQAEKAHQGWIIGVVAGCEFVNDLIATRKQEVAAAESTRREQQTRIKDLAKWLEEHAEDKPLENDFPEIRTDLDKLQSARASVTAAKAKSEGFTAKIAAQRKQIEDGTAKLTAAETNLKKRTEEKYAADNAFQQLLAGKSEESRETELSVLRKRSAGFEILLEKETLCQGKRVQLEQQRSNLEGLKPKLKEAEAAVAEARTRQQEAERQVDRLQDHLEKSILIASLEQHRAHLKPDEACPLCGATEHPFVKGKSAVGSVDNLRTDLEKAKVIKTKAAEETRQKELVVQNLRNNSDHLQATLKQTEIELNKLVDEMVRLAAERQITARGSAELTQAQLAHQASLKRAEAELLAIAAARAGLTKLDTERAQAESALTLLRQSQANEEKNLATMVEDQREHALALKQFEVDLARVSEALTCVLPNYSLGLPAAGQEQTLARLLKERLTAYQGQAQALDKANLELERAAADLQKRKASLEDLERRAKPFIDHLCAHENDGKAVDPSTSGRTKALWKTVEDAEDTAAKLHKELEASQAALTHQQTEAKRAAQQVEQLTAALLQSLQGSPFPSLDALRTARLSSAEAHRLEDLDRQLHTASEQLKGNFEGVRQNIQSLREAKAVEGEAVLELENKVQHTQRINLDVAQSVGRLRSELDKDEQNRRQHTTKTAQLETERKRLVVWKQLQGLIGSHDGKKFRRYAQGISLEILIQNGNQHLRRLTDRYRLRRRAGEELELEIEDLYQAGTTRPMASLSGGESFLTSLALALGLAALAGRNVQIDSLFIDEGFGSLDATTLDLAISALEALRQDNKTIGVISHVELLKERIATQILVERKPGGTSTLRLVS